ncbi:MAG: hypothetical protein LH654_01775, partial [Thermoleophilia bacterium]|nr:hypothetical protein [Thermoleophilia bacterium]
MAQLTKRHPARPGSVMLIGPSGVGKTSTIEALPRALQALGTTNAHVFRIDNGDPRSPARAPRRGRLTAPAGRTIDAKHVFVALTTSLSSGDLAEALEGAPLENRWAVQRACVRHLRSSGIPADLLARVGAFAYYREMVEEVARTHVARAALLYLWGQPSAGVMCPISMTYSAIPALRADPALAAEWEPRLTLPDYARGALAGMAMTEKQGGSDVRANTTQA